VHKDFYRLCIRSENNEFCNATIQSFGGFISALLQLFIVLGLLNEVEDLARKVCWGKRPGFGGGGVFGHGKWVDLTAIGSLVSES